MTPYLLKGQHVITGSKVIVIYKGSRGRRLVTMGIITVILPLPS